MPASLRVAFAVSSTPLIASTGVRSSESSASNAEATGCGAVTTGSGAVATGSAVATGAGAVVGGLIGKSITESVDPTEDAYWRQQYPRRPYFKAGRRYEDYEPAYRLGYRAYDAYRGEYDDRLDDNLRRTYEGDWRGESQLEWDDARHAARDAYMHRADRLGRASEV